MNSVEAKFTIESILRIDLGWIASQALSQNRYDFPAPLARDPQPIDVLPAPVVTAQSRPAQQARSPTVPRPLVHRALGDQQRDDHGGDQHEFHNCRRRKSSMDNETRVMFSVSPVAKPPGDWRADPVAWCGASIGVNYRPAGIAGNATAFRYSRSRSYRAASTPALHFGHRLSDARTSMMEARNGDADDDCRNHEGSGIHAECEPGVARLLPSETNEVERDDEHWDENRRQQKRS